MLKAIAIFAVISVLFNSATISASRGTFGIVEGIFDCGGFGKLGQVSVSDCTDLPCHFIPNNVYDITIRFTASATSESLKLFVDRIIDPPLTVNLFNLPIDGTIVGGIEYDLAFQLPVSRDLAGEAFNILFTIVDEQNTRAEICAEGSVTIGQ